MIEDSRNTGQLIADLSGSLEPVRPLRPPLLRAGGWLLLIALLLLVPLLRFTNWPRFIARLADARLLMEWIATLATGVLAIAASFIASIPGRSERWRWLPLPTLILWLCFSGMGCLKNGVGEADFSCLMFITAAGLPLSLLLFVWLRRARPIAPLPVALLGALGVAALSAAVLQLFHPFDVTVLDFAVHLAAVALLLLIGASAGRRGLCAT